jgi:hypothetical protein
MLDSRSAMERTGTTPICLAETANLFLPVQWRPRADAGYLTFVERGWNNTTRPRMGPLVK